MSQTCEDTADMLPQRQQAFFEQKGNGYILPQQARARPRQSRPPSSFCKYQNAGPRQGRSPPSLPGGPRWRPSWPGGPRCRQALLLGGLRCREALAGRPWSFKKRATKAFGHCGCLRDLRHLTGKASYGRKALPLPGGLCRDVAV